MKNAHTTYTHMHACINKSIHRYSLDESHYGAGAALYHIINDLIEVVPLAANLHGAVDGDNVLEAKERNYHHSRSDGFPVGRGRRLC